MSEPNTEAYAASKGALVALTHAMAISLGPRVRVNAIAPGWISDGQDLRPIDHEQHPVGRVGCPDDIAGAVLYLAGAGFVYNLGEPVLGTGGIVPPPAGYWPAIQAVLRKYDVLLIADEVVTGFGRTGAMFGSIKYEMEPDLITVDHHCPSFSSP